MGRDYMTYSENCGIMYTKNEHNLRNSQDIKKIEHPGGQTMSKTFLKNVCSKYSHPNEPVSCCDNTDNGKPNFFI